MLRAIVEMTCDRGVAIVINVKIVTIESCKYFILSLAYVLYATMRTSYEIDTICGLAVNIDHGV